MRLTLVWDFSFFLLCLNWHVCIFSSNYHWVWKLHTGPQSNWIVFLYMFLQTVWLWLLKEKQCFLSSESRTLGHWATVIFFYSFMNGFWDCSCDCSCRSVCDVSWSTHPSLLEPLKDVVILNTCAPFCTKCFPSTKLSLICFDAAF